MALIRCDTTEIQITVRMVGTLYYRLTTHFTITDLYCCLVGPSTTNVVEMIGDEGVQFWQEF